MFVSDSLEVIDFEVLSEEVSDHAALFLEIGSDISTSSHTPPPTS